MHKKLYWISVLCLSIAIVLLAYLNVEAFKEPEKISANVLRVIDGDTLDINIPGPANGDAGRILTCRLYGIDAPEHDQPYGLLAKDYLVSLAKKEIKVGIVSSDLYGRQICIIDTNFGDNINIEMISAGYAWAYKQYLSRPYASEYIDAEKVAREKKLGLWKDSNPTPPWEFRKSKKNKKKQ